MPPVVQYSIPIPIGKLSDDQGLATNCGEMHGAIGGVSTARGESITPASPPSWSTTTAATDTTSAPTSLNRGHVALVSLALIDQGLEFQEAQLRLLKIDTRSRSIGIDQQDSRIILSRLDVIGQNCYLFPILKIIEVVVIMEMSLEMVMHLVGIKLATRPE